MQTALLDAALHLEASEPSYMDNSSGHPCIGVPDHVYWFFWNAVVSKHFPEGASVIAVKCVLVVYEVDA